MNLLFRLDPERGLVIVLKKKKKGNIQQRNKCAQLHRKFNNYIWSCFPFFYFIFSVDLKNINVTLQKSKKMQHLYAFVRWGERKILWDTNLPGILLWRTSPKFCHFCLLVIKFKTAEQISQEWKKIYIYSHQRDIKIVKYKIWSTIFLVTLIHWN